jgi:hypothetical protein
VGIASSPLEETESYEVTFEEPQEKVYKCTLKKTHQLNEYLDSICTSNPNELCKDYKKAINKVLVSCNDLVSEGEDMRKIKLLEEYLQQVLKIGNAGSIATAQNQLKLLNKYKLHLQQCKKQNVQPSDSILYGEFKKLLNAMEAEIKD